MDSIYSRYEKHKKEKKKEKRRKKTIVGIVMALLGYGIFVWSYDVRLWLAGSLLITQHSFLAKYTLVGEDTLKKLQDEINHPKVVNSENPKGDSSHGSNPILQKEGPLTEIIPIEKNSSPMKYFKGKLVKVSDPNRLHLVKTVGGNYKWKGKERGELITEFTKRTHAIVAINASGFYDPNWDGNARYTSGLEMIDGKVLQDYQGSDTALGITYDGKLITGHYSAKELLHMGVRDAMTFKPQLLVNGQNLFKDGDKTGFGVAPRTAVGQTADGTILLLVIDGRQPGHSLGATMKDIADMMEEYGAVNAMAMDGGSSSIMTYQGDIVTKASTTYDVGRFIPNAWVVY